MWRIGTLMHERATLGAGVQITFKRQFDRLVQLSHTIQRNGKPAAEDPVMRQKLAQSYVEIEIMRLNQMRAITRINQKRRSGAGRLHSENLLDGAEPALPADRGGAAGTLRAIDEGRPSKPSTTAQWAYSFLRARGNTIEAGTSEIQRNIVGHFVLGLPKSY